MAIEDFAPTIGISASYLRAVEAGKATLPVDAVKGLAWTHGGNYAALAGLLVLAKVLDERTNRDPEIAKILDIATSVLKAEREYVANGAPQLSSDQRHLLENVVEALELSLLAERQRAVVDDRTETIAKLGHVLKRIEGRVSGWLNGRGLDSAKSESKRRDQSSFVERFNLSPVFQDLIEGFAARLSLFPPQTTSFEFAKWEAMNSDRITRVSAYHSDPERLITFAPKYTWAFLWNQNQPEVCIYVPLGKSAAHLQKGLREAIYQVGPKGKNGRRDTKVHLQEIKDKSLLARCIGALGFNFAQPEKPPDGTFAAENVEPYRTFSNAWLYELLPDTGEAQPDPKRKHHIGFLDALQESLTETYAVVMSQPHVKCWQKIFDDAEKA